jgi:hypothetical protein
MKAMGFLSGFSRKVISISINIVIHRYSSESRNSFSLFTIGGASLATSFPSIRRQAGREASRVGSWASFVVRTKKKRKKEDWWRGQPPDVTSKESPLSSSSEENWNMLRAAACVEVAL